MEAFKLSDLPGKLPDNLVIKRVLSGEKELFEILLRRYNQTLFRVIRSYLKDEDDVQDAMQEAYLKAYDKLQQFKGDSSFSTWLIRIGINEALLRIRSLKKTRSLYNDEDDLQAEKIIQIPDSLKMNPEKKLINKEVKTLIEQAVDQLPSKYKTIYILKEIEGMDNEEIANALDLSSSNVKVRLHRAKELLKDALYVLSTDTEIFEFGKSKCDRLIDLVMKRI
jgi:RNA polymerase sigma factor (sigma-70 family)